MFSITQVGEDSQRDSFMVYFVEDQSRRVKIGYTAKQVDRRIQSLQIGNPERLTLLGVMPGGPIVESSVHRKFAHCHIRGEWYHMNEEISEYIQAINEKSRCG